MTIDKMIKALSSEPEFGDIWVDEEACAVIIAALKAGVMLRNNERGAWEAWDAATQEVDK